MMPLQYSGVMDEHRTVRQAAGLFRREPHGPGPLHVAPDALAAAHRLVHQQRGQAGGRPGPLQPHLLPGRRHRRRLPGLPLRRRSRCWWWSTPPTSTRTSTGSPADRRPLQGGQPERRARAAGAAGAAGLRDRWPSVADARLSPGRRSSPCCGRKAGGVECLASRTGYTGEDGFEIACAPEDAPDALGRPDGGGRRRSGIKPCGLGARDTLRLEAKLPPLRQRHRRHHHPAGGGPGLDRQAQGRRLHRPEALVDSRRPKGSRASWSASRCAAAASRARAPHLPARRGGRPRASVIGQVTSGTKSPTLGGHRLGLCAQRRPRAGTRLVVDVRGKPVEAEVDQGPLLQASAVMQSPTAARIDAGDRTHGVPQGPAIHQGP